MAQITLVINDELGAEQMRIGFAVPGSANAQLSDGRSVPADQVQVGDHVRICDGCYRQVAAVEVV